MYKRSSLKDQQLVHYPTRLDLSVYLTSVRLDFYRIGLVFREFIVFFRDGDWVGILRVLRNFLKRGWRGIFSGI